MAFAFKKDKNWKRLQLMMEPGKANAVVKRHLRRATRLNGKVAEKQIRDSIKSGSYAANAELTEAIKGTNKPLVGIGAGAQLFGGITSRMMDDTTLFVGVLKTSDVYDIAVTLHEGLSIGVTNKMRGMFFALWQASIGKLPPEKLTGRAAELFAQMSSGWKPLRKSTAVIVIPSRPFIEQAFADKTIRNTSKKNWQAALRAAFAEIKAAGA
jgi:hypothetical protein